MIVWSRAGLGPTCEETVSLRNMGIMQYLQTEARKEVDPKGERWRLFDRNSPDKINTGSLIKVSYQDSRSAANVTTFTGVLLAIRRSTGAPTIHVRGIIDGVAVEQVFCIFSPLLRDIQVLKTLPRRTDKKFYYLRERPHEIGRLQNLSSQLEQHQPRTARK